MGMKCNEIIIINNNLYFVINDSMAVICCQQSLTNLYSEIILFENIQRKKCVEYIE